MELITKKYSYLFSKSYERTGLLLLEILCVVAIIAYLSGLALKAGIENVYKTSHTQLLTTYITTARLNQHESFAWNGTFDKAQGEYLIEDGSLISQNLVWDASTTRIESEAYKHIKAHYLTFELQSQFGATLVSKCGQTDLPFALLPYNCKIQYYNEK